MEQNEGMFSIYADWNSRDEQGRFVLSIAGAQRDIAKYEDQLSEGLVVLLNVQDEFEVRATLVFDGVWLGIPDESSIRFYDVAEEPE